MRPDPRLLWTLGAVALACALGLAAFVLAGAVLLRSELTEDEQAAWSALTEGRAALLLLPGAAVVATAVAAAAAVYRRRVTAPAQLTEQARVLLATPGARAEADAAWPEDLRELARCIDELAAQRERLRADMAQEVTRASLRIEQERNRLAALMSELTQSVVVCNLDGRVLLYNARARLQFRALWVSTSALGGAELIGLGRSIYGALDRDRVVDALQGLQLRLSRGADNPTAEFINTTPGGHVLRVQMAPVRAAGESQVSGFVLVLHNITQEVARARDLRQRLDTITQGGVGEGPGSLARLERSLLSLQDMQAGGSPPAERSGQVEAAAVAAAHEPALKTALEAAARLRADLRHLEQGIAADLPRELEEGAAEGSDPAAKAAQARRPGPAAVSGVGEEPDDSRPVFYDFDLFAQRDSAQAIEDRPLVELSFTVFDTETTGLDPAGGDEIIQIGAVRLVNGRLLRGEDFDQLVDPRRPIPRASIPIHGITPERVRGQPPIEQVLPAFHRYAQDTVLVAHNAAFDMRFLQLKEAAAGVRFDQPLLDTLLLSAVVNPKQDTHSLEAIAQRLGVTVVGRHTALGDAIVTAEVFRKLIPLLAERGVRTLGQAREAAQQTRYARLEY